MDVKWFSNITIMCSKVPVFFAFLVTACVVSTQVQGAPDGIIRQDFETPDENGAYRWALQTEGGIYHEQRGRLEPSASGEPALVVEGQYQYTAPDGQVIHVQYTADENGFHPRILSAAPAPSYAEQ